MKKTNIEFESLEKIDGMWMRVTWRKADSFAERRAVKMVPAFAEASK